MTRTTSSIPLMRPLTLLLLSLLSQATLPDAAARGAAVSGQDAPLRVLFLGDQGHHRPADRYKDLAPVLKRRGIEMVYTEAMDDLSADTLNRYDALMLYANIDSIKKEQADALLAYVERGGGFVPLHCATYCFRNDPRMVALMGAQFRMHQAAVFSAINAAPKHPVMQGFQGFESWDETYVHHKHNEKNRTVLQYREGSAQAPGKKREPWTWVRTQGKGRVFYTAWGHDRRTWGQAGFHELVERGVRWVTAERLIAKHAKQYGTLDPDKLPPSPTQPKAGPKPFKYAAPAGKIPLYEPRGSRRGGGAWNKMQLPLSAEQSRERIVTPRGFEVKLFAAEPDIKPSLAMAWDERGRLWLCESIDYPNDIKPLGEGRDSIKICEDTDGDGKADKFTVFADNLSICTSLTFFNGGVIVHQAPQTLFLKDTDGDDKADIRQVLFEGWNAYDTHAGPSNLHYGYDNWLWGMQGYAGVNTTIAGERHNFRMGFYRFKVGVSQAGAASGKLAAKKMEFLRSTNNNTWGLGFSEENIVFGSTANGNPSDYMPIPNRYYEAVRGWAPTTLGGIADTARFHPITEKVRQVDFHGAYTAAAGHSLYTARAYPKAFWNRTAFVNGPTGKLTGIFELQSDGAGYKSRNRYNLVASDDEWFSPIMAEVGPDGCVWVLDWYNYIVQHNPTPVGFKTGKGNAYMSELRDKRHGRVYRVVPKGMKTAPTLSLSKEQPKQLVTALTNDNRFWRMHAQRLLVERGKADVVPALIQLVGDTSTDGIGLNPGAIHALWTLHGLGVIDDKHPAVVNAVIAAMKHPSAGVRRNALKVAMPNASTRLAAGVVSSDLINDEDAQVRLAAFLALADAPSDPRVGAAIFAALKQPRNAEDRWLSDAITAAAAKHDAGFIQAVLASTKRTPTTKPSTAPREVERVNLIRNAGFEQVHDGKPAGWRQVRYSGDATFSVEKRFARTGKHCVKIKAKNGTDASWTIDVPVKPHHRYELRAWVKTEGLAKGSGNGAQINLHQLQRTGKTRAVVGDNDWTLLESTFDSAGHSRLSFNLLFGGWGQSKGEAWWDDIALYEVGPSRSAPTLASSQLPGKAGQVVSIVTRHYAERGPKDTVVETIAALTSTDHELSTFVLKGLLAGWPRGLKVSLNDAQRSKLDAVYAAIDADERDLLLQLTKPWGDAKLFRTAINDAVKKLAAQVSNGALPTPARVTAAKRLVQLQDEPAQATAILTRINATTPPDLATGLIDAVGLSKHDETGAALVKRLTQLSPSAMQRTIQVLAKRTAWTHTLLDAIEAKQLAASVLSATDWQLLKSRRDGGIASRAKKLDKASPSPDRQKVLAKLMPIVAPDSKIKGDIKRGQAIFTQLCAQCHTIDGKGGKVGPELTGIGARPPREIMLEIVDPNRSVESNFRMWTVNLSFGDVITGRLDGESKTSIEMLDLVGKRHVIQREDIDTLSASPLSIMPVGLIDSLPHSDIASLIKFLSASKAKH